MSRLESFPEIEGCQTLSASTKDIILRLFWVKLVVRAANPYSEFLWERAPLFACDMFCSIPVT